MVALFPGFSPEWIEAGVMSTGLGSVRESVEEVQGLHTYL